MKEKDYRLFEKKLREVCSLRARIDYLALRNENNNDIKKAKSEIEFLEAAITHLNKSEQEIIKGIYFEGRSLPDMSLKLGYSSSYCSRLKVIAVKKLMNIMDMDNTKEKDGSSHYFC